MTGELTAYDQLKQMFHDIGILRSMAGTLNWDAAVNLPAGARRVRAEQLAYIDGAIHDRLSGGQTRDLLDAARDSDKHLAEWDQINLGLMEREVAHVTAVPKDTSSALVRAQANCEGVWIKAKPADDFEAVLPFAEEVLLLTREAAQAKSGTFGTSSHEALMDYWDPGTSAADLQGLFGGLKARLPSIIDSTDRRQSGSNQSDLPTVPIHLQFEICQRLAEEMGYDFEHGRLDQSAQAFFVDDSPEDVRVTTRCNEADYRSAVFGILHEIGHSFYERAMPADWLYQPIGRPASAGMQESQSLLFENLISRHPAFLSMIAGHVGSVFSEANLTVDQLSKDIRNVERSLLRTDADEVTYPLHVIIRYDLEAELISGALTFADLPAAWDDAYLRLLDISPENNRQGCLQDIHWYRGLYGYFQSYVLGSLISAQLLEAATAATPEIEAGLEVADLAPLKSWLEANIYRKGRSMPAGQLVHRVTGQPISVEPLLTHLERRYVSGPTIAH